MSKRKNKDNNVSDSDDDSSWSSADEVIWALSKKIAAVYLFLLNDQINFFWKNSNKHLVN